MSEYEDLLTKYELYNKKLLIDKHNLDEEYVHQPAFHNEVGRAWANAINFRDASELHVKNTEATLNNKHRQEALDSGQKITEDRLKHLVTSDLKMIKAQQNFLEWKYLANLYYKLTESFGQRPAALDNLVKLFLAEYYKRESIRTVEGARQNQVAKEVQQRQAQLRKPLVHSRNQA